MNNKDVVKQDQREEHSLPGTNQSGKGPSPVEHDDHEKRPPEGDAQPEEQIAEHSLPGTNQAGKGPGPIKRDD